MPTPEEILVEKIKDAELAQSLARKKVSDAKLAFYNAESELIECSINKDRLIEELRVLRLKKVNRNQTPEEKDIERFKKALPDLLEKIK